MAAWYLVNCEHSVQLLEQTHVVIYLVFRT